jgi:long-chain acyl-CoA synthetase
VTDARLDEIGRQIAPDDLASLVYTSGTTGVPKGAMITHANLVFTANAASKVLSIEPHFCTLLFLPLAHVFARMIVYMCQRAALCTAFAEDIGQVPANLQEIRPHFIVSVPRIYEKIHEKIVATAEEGAWLRRKLFAWAVEVGRQVARLRLDREPVPVWLGFKRAVADRLVLHRVRDLFGGRIAWVVSGAAPLNVKVNEFFHACGVVVIQGLGMTENTSLSNANRLHHNKPSTVGPIVPGLEMKCAEDGEVLFRGPNVMTGYFKDPEGTAETIDADGWLHSGDIGEIDEDGFLTITDRKKDLIVTAGGKNVAPQRVEKTLGTSRYISQVVACGDRRKFITALITLDAANIGTWAEANGLGEKSTEELSREPKVRELIEAEVAERNRELASFESVKKFHILPEDLSIESGDLTPTLKVRRKVVYEKHRDVLEGMYRD